MNHQEVTAALKQAGFVSLRATHHSFRNGYQVKQINGYEVGVLCYPYSVEQVASTLIEAGLRVYQSPNAARDALFVRRAKP